jgi:hypothetical protein
MARVAEKPATPAAAPATIETRVVQVKVTRAGRLVTAGLHELSDAELRELARHHNDDVLTGWRWARSLSRVLAGQPGP